MATGDSGYPWNIDVETLASRTGRPVDYCRDAVTVHWLKAGDARALADFLLQGHVPGDYVLRYLAWMILGDDNAKDIPPEIPSDVPYRLVTKRRSGAKGRPINRENETRDRLLAKNVRRLMSEGLSYEEAITRVEDAGFEGGVHVDFQTIKKAYDKRKGKKSRN